MASIAEYLQAIMNARYGRDVRQSIHDAIDAINTQEEGHVSVIEGYTEDAEAWAKGTKGGTPVESTDPAYHNNAKYYAEETSEDAEIAEGYAKGTKNGTPVVDGETGYHDNSKYYSEQASSSAQSALEQAQIAVQAAQSITGALKPKGTVTFANLPSVATADTGDMYNISTDFTTTSDFEEGAGVDYTKGTNVYKTANGKWDVLAGLPIQYIGTRAEINAAVTAGIITEGMMIYCTDEEGATNITATMVEYDNTNSGLSATSAQGAIDELKSDLSGVTKTVTPSAIVQYSGISAVQVGAILNIYGYAAINGAATDVANKVLTINNYDGMERRGIAYFSDFNGKGVTYPRNITINTSGELLCYFYSDDPVGNLLMINV